MHLPRPLVLLAATLGTLLAPSAAAQAPRLILIPEPPRTARWVGHAGILAGNATISALTAGVLQRLRGGSLKDGLVRGALGGVVSYAGKRVAAQEFWGAGLLGREIHAVGVSVVRNASDGEASFSRLFLPLGPLPVRAAITLTHRLRVEPQIDIAAAARLSTGLFGSGQHLDLGASLSSGAPVFQAEGRWLVDAERSVLAYAVSRSVFLGDRRLYREALPPQALVLAHERVHVLQQDFVLTAWGDPLARAVLGRFDAGRRIQHHVTVDALGWVAGLASRLMYGADEERFPAEFEARFLTHR